MDKRNYLETEEYQSMITIEKKIFEDAIKKLENRDIEILYFDKENLLYKKYQNLRFETQKYYIDGLTRGMSHEDSFIYSKKESKKIILYSIKFAIFVTAILILIMIQDEKLRFQDIIIESSMLIFSVVVAVTACVTTQASKIMLYKSAKIVGSIAGIVGLYVYVVYLQ